MTFASKLLPALTKIRAIPGPTGLGVRSTSVVLRTRTWSGGRVQLGTSTVVDLEILPRPKVRKEGESGNLVVGPITPSNLAGGYTPAQLHPSDAAGSEYYYVVTGPEGVARNYAARWLDDRHPFSYYLHLDPDDRAVPF